MQEEKKPILIFRKNADKIANRMIIPRTFCEKYGYEFYMEIYEDEIRLKPVKKEGK